MKFLAVLFLCAAAVTAQDCKALAAKVPECGVSHTSPLPYHDLGSDNSILYFILAIG